MLDMRMLETDRGSSRPDPRDIDFDERWRRRSRWILAIVVFSLLVFVVVGALFIAPAGAGGGGCGGG